MMKNVLSNCVARLTPKTALHEEKELKRDNAR
jgi:hypothetical protein